MHHYNKKMSIFLEVEGNFEYGYRTKYLINLDRVDSVTEQNDMVILMIGKRKYYRSFSDESSSKEFINKYFKSTQSNHKLEQQIDKLSQALEEIRDMIKYHPSGQICQDAKADFDSKKK